MEDRIVSEFNAVLGTQVDNISKGHELFDKCVKKLNEIESKVSEENHPIKLCLHFSIASHLQLTLDEDNDKASPVIRSVLQKSEDIVNATNEKFDYVELYSSKVQCRIDKFQKIQHEIQSHLDKIAELEHLLEYFKILQDIQDINSDLENCIYSKDEQKIVGLFLSLSGSPESSDSVVGRLQDVDASNMKLYARRVALYWHEMIKQKLSR